MCSKVFNVFVLNSSAQNQKVCVQISSQTCWIAIEKIRILIFFFQERVTRTFSSSATATIVLSYTAASRFSQEKILEVHLFMKVLIQFIVCPQPGRERRWLHLFCAACVIRSSEWSPVIQGNRSGLVSFQLLAHCVTRVHSSCQYIHYHLLIHHINMFSFIGKINPAQHHFYFLWLSNIHNSVLRFCCLLSGSSGLSIECCKAKRNFSLSFWIIEEGYVTNTFVCY